MRRVCSLLVLTLSLLLSSGIHAADWAQFRGPAANGISPEKGLKKSLASSARALWKVPMSDNGYAGPSVAGGKVFIIDHHGSNDIVRAINLQTGKDIWKYTYADESRDNYGFSRSTPVVSGGKVYTVSRQGKVHCLNASNGQKIWMRNLQSEFHGKKPQWDYSMSVLIDGSKAIVVPGGANAAVVALHKDTGKTIWQGGGSDFPGYATPVAATLNGKKQYVVFMGEALIGVDTNSGKLLWRFPWKTSCDVNAAAPIVLGNSVFISSGYNHGCALVDVSGSTAKARWMNREIIAQFSSPIYADGYIYGTGDPGYLVCLDPKTGRAKWKHQGFEKGGIIGADGKIFAMAGNSGDLVSVSMTPAGYHELGRSKPLGGQSWTAPVIADGKLIVRNKTTLACYALK